MQSDGFKNRFFFFFLEGRTKQKKNYGKYIKGNSDSLIYFRGYFHANEDCNFKGPIYCSE